MDWSATGIVKVNRTPWSGPRLSARIRPPWASTIPFEMDSPKPDPAISRSTMSLSIRGMFPEQVGQLVGQHSTTFGRHRNRNV